MRFKPLLIIFYTVAVIVVMTALRDTLGDQSAAIKFLFWETQEYPLLLFVAGAFLAGLLAGLIVAMIDNLHYRKEIRDLKKEAASAKKPPERNPPTA